MCGSFWWPLPGKSQSREASSAAQAGHPPGLVPGAQRVESGPCARGALGGGHRNPRCHPESHLPGLCHIVTMPGVSGFI